MMCGVIKRGGVKWLTKVKYEEILGEKEEREKSGGKCEKDI
jgi:hypothetical protein